MIRVLQFADIINKNDFIDIIIQRADPAEFQFFACVRDPHSNIAPPEYSSDIQRFIIPGLGRFQIPMTAWRLARLLKRKQIDILHTHHYDQAVIGWLATRLCPRTRLIIGRHYSDAIYLLAKGLRKRLLLQIESHANSAADCIIVPSKAISRILTEQGVASGKIRVVHYAFSPEKWETAQRMDIKAFRAELGLTGLTFGSFSRMHPEKGLTYLLQAIAKVRSRLPGVQVLLVGDGPARADLEKEIKRLDLTGHVRLLGWRTDALAVMAAVDVVLHPSLQEAFPQAMIEALYLRKPLVITSVSGAVDVIENGVNGIMIPMRDPGALADTIEMLSSDASLRRRLGDAGRRYVEEHFTVDRIIPQFEQIYRDLKR